MYNKKKVKESGRTSPGSILYIVPLGTNWKAYHAHGYISQKAFVKHALEGELNKTEMNKTEMNNIEKNSTKKNNIKMKNTEMQSCIDTKLAVIAIVVEREESVRELNELLHDYSRYILGRMGIPHRTRGVSLISVAMDAPADTISALSGRLGRITGVSAKVAYSKI